MNFLIKVLISATIAYVLSIILTGVHINGLVTAFIFALVLALLNTIVKPILIILTLPVTIVTLGLFLLVVNTLIVLLADKFISGIKIDGFWWAFLFSILLSVFDTAVEKTIADKK